jgi:hypothetical protein
MAFKQIQDLDADITVSLGGINKKTGKKNPTKVEGYYIGNRTVESKKDKKGFAYIYFFQTQNGMLGVWGKTDLDRKMKQVKPGTMTLVSQSGTVTTPNGDMYKFTVAVDSDNTIEVADHSASAEPTSAPEETSYASQDDDAEEDEDTAELDEPAPAPRATAPSRPATAPNAERQAKVQALLNRSRT